MCRCQQCSVPAVSEGWGVTLHAWHLHLPLAAKTHTSWAVKKQSLFHNLLDRHQKRESMSEKKKGKKVYRNRLQYLSEDHHKDQFQKRMQDTEEKERKKVYRNRLQSLSKVTTKARFYSQTQCSVQEGDLSLRALDLYLSPHRRVIFFPNRVLHSWTHGWHFGARL